MIKKAVIGDVLIIAESVSSDKVYIGLYEAIKSTSFFGMINKVKQGRRIACGSYYISINNLVIDKELAKMVASDQNLYDLALKIRNSKPKEGYELTMQNFDKMWHKPGYGGTYDVCVQFSSDYSEYESICNVSLPAGILDTIPAEEALTLLIRVHFSEKAENERRALEKKQKIEEEYHERIKELIKKTNKSPLFESETQDNT